MSSCQEGWSKCETGSFPPHGDLLCQRAVVGVSLALLGGAMGAGLLIVSTAEGAHGLEVFLWKSERRELGGRVGREQVVQGHVRG